MELSKQDTQRAKGAAVLGMVMLHLFCRLGDLPYTPWFWIGEVPIIYYLGLFGDVCVPIFCFCSGYAHYLLREKHQARYPKYIAGKILRFLLNYWVVLILFSVVGLLSGNRSDIPGTVSDFMGNLLLYRLSYNGAWWFVITYILLSWLSGILAWITDRVPVIPLCVASGGIYFASYMFRFDWSRELSNPVINWIWQQTILVGTSQFGYMTGMICRKQKWISTLRGWLDRGKCIGCILGKTVIWLLPVVAFLGHCIVQSMFVAPFTAFAVMISLFLCKIPAQEEWMLQLLGKHSTNIWLVHMFFYLTLFEGFVFIFRSPVFICLFMILICLCVSRVVDGISVAIIVICRYVMSRVKRF